MYKLALLFFQGVPATGLHHHLYRVAQKVSHCQFINYHFITIFISSHQRAHGQLMPADRQTDEQQADQ